MSPLPADRRPPRRNVYSMPRWWRDCRDRKGHSVSILSRRDEWKLEYFCGDCNDGAGRGEIVKSTRAPRETR